jgi:hypothetical protein
MLNSPAFGSLNVTPEVSPRYIFKIKQGPEVVWSMQIDEHLYAEADAMVSEAAMTCAVSNLKWFLFFISSREKSSRRVRERTRFLKMFYSNVFVDKK